MLTPDEYLVFDDVGRRSSESTLEKLFRECMRSCWPWSLTPSPEIVGVYIERIQEPIDFDGIRGVEFERPIGSERLDQERKEAISMALSHPEPGNVERRGIGVSIVVMEDETLHLRVGRYFASDGMGSMPAMANAPLVIWQRLRRRLER